MNPIFTVIIVSYNTKELLAKCLDAVLHEQEEVDCRIIVVDNASEDGSAEIVRRKYPLVTLFAGTSNRGFAAANNLAAQEAEGELLFLLNPDTEMQPGCLTAAREYMAGHPEVGMAGPVILDADSTLHDSLEYEYPGQHYHHAVAEGLPGNIAWILGAALVVRSDVFRAVGGFDERFFLYAEDIDLSFKIRKKGWQLGYIDGAGVIHIEGQSEQCAPAREVLERKTRAECIFLEKHYPHNVYRKIRRARLLQAWWRIASLHCIRKISRLGREQEWKLLKYQVIVQVYSQYQGKTND